jgi:methylenetetrahydrofolate dehydrogenase (NADP+)/methenyltetrahydrofolate cyclohydrolase
MAIILDGKKARVFYTSLLKERILKIAKKSSLAIIQIGNREESSAYINQKKKFAEEIGVSVSHLNFSENVSEKDVISKIDELNKDDDINGIILQLPIPENLNKEKIINTINYKKDTDGLTKENLERRTTNQGSIVPATARGVLELLNFYNIEIKNKKVAVLGRSELAGSPIAFVMEKAGARVTVCNSQTLIEEEKKITKNSDIVIIAIGKPEFLNKNFISQNKQQVVVDVGINSVFDDKNGFSKNADTKLLEEVKTAKRLVGDVDYRNIIDLVSAISPVPGGVGQMTVLGLFENLIDCIENYQ